MATAMRETDEQLSGFPAPEGAASRTGNSFADFARLVLEAQARGADARPGGQPGERGTPEP